MLGNRPEIRLDELERIKTLLLPGMSVLDVGGGTGLQAKTIASWGCQVSSIDIGRADHLEFDVQVYDGQHFPFEDASFDVVFSSNVLEHVPHLDQMFEEVRRVLRPGGKAVHLMPSTTWRLWTSLAHYPYGLSVLLRGRSKHAASEGSDPGGGHRGSRSLAAPAHGEYRNALVELWTFSRMRWKKVLTRGGFTVMASRGARLFYTGYGLTSLSLATRRVMSRVLGSSCNLYITQPR